MKKFAALTLAATLAAPAANAAIIQYDFRAGLDRITSEWDRPEWDAQRDYSLTVDTQAGALVGWSTAFVYGVGRWEPGDHAPDLPVAFRFEDLDRGIIRLRVTEPAAGRNSEGDNRPNGSPVRPGEYFIDPLNVFVFTWTDPALASLENLHLAEIAVSRTKGWNWTPSVDAGYALAPARRTVIESDAPAAVPEPATLGLAALGLLGCGLRRRFHRS